MAATSKTVSHLGQAAGDLFGPAAARFTLTKEDAEPFSIRFADRNPLEARFADGVMTTTLRGKSFTSGEREIGGWNTTARDLIDELKGDDYHSKVVVIADLDKNPAGSGIYFVRGDVTNAEDLQRAGIEEAAAASLCITMQKREIP